MRQLFIQQIVQIIQQIVQRVVLFLCRHTGAG